MNSLDLISMGLKNLWRRKLRTFLTVLGVIIGTASIVIMVSLGFGMSENFKGEISKMGSLNTINVHPPYDMVWEGDKPVRNANKNKVTLDDKAVADFQSISGVEAVSPMLESYAKFVSGRYYADIPIKGIVPETMEAFDFEVTDGRTLQEGDTFNLVFGANAPTMFQDQKFMMGRDIFYYDPEAEPSVNVLKDRLIMTFDMSYGIKTRGQNPNPDTKLYNKYKVKGVGILKSGDYEKDYYVFMPLNQLEKIIEEREKAESKISGIKPSTNSRNKNKYDRVMVKVKDMKDVQEIQQQIKDMGFEAYSLTDFLDSMQKTMATIQAVLGGIGAVSLLVAALGITNTMIMSIYERTKEIGIMKVIGAALSDIGKIFLFEASIIGTIGGLFGIAISYLASLVLNKLAAQFGAMGPDAFSSKISIIPLWLAVSSIMFTTIVGLVSGSYPARRAMKLSPLEAIRTE